MEEVLSTPQKDESIRNDQVTDMEKSLTIDEAGKSGGDDEVEVGATIGEAYDNEDATEVDSMDEDDDGVVIVTSKNSLRRGTPLKGRGFSSRTPGKDPNNVSATATKDSSALATSSENASGPEDELQKLRFNRHFTAFDVNIESLPEHPWRDKNVDVSDYFNYGFTERTWLIYCEKQLRLRAEKGFGPRDPTTQPSKPFGPTVLNSSITASMVDSSIRDNPELAGTNEVVSDDEESPTNTTEVKPDISINFTTESNISTGPVPMMPTQIAAPMPGLPPPPPPPPQMMAMHPGQQPYAMMPPLMPPMPPGRGPPPPPPAFAPPPHFPPGVSGMPGMPPPPGMFNFPPNSSFAPPPPPSIPLPPQPSTTDIGSSSDNGNKRRRTDETVSRDGGGDTVASSRSTKRPREDSRDRERDRDREGSKRTSDRERDRDRDREKDRDRDRDTRYRDSRDEDRSSRKKSRHSRSRSTSRRRR